MRIVRRVSSMAGLLALVALLLAVRGRGVGLVPLVLLCFVLFVIRAAWPDREKEKEKEPAQRVAFAKFLPDGQILTVTPMGAIERYEVDHWTRLERIDSLPADASRHVLSADGCFLAWAIVGYDDEWCVSLSAINTGNRVREVEFDGILSSVLVSPDGSLFGLVDHIKGIHLWSGRTGESVPVLSDARSQTVSFAFAEFVVFSPDGRFLSGGDDDAVYIWDLERKDLVQVLGGHAHVSALSYNPDGTLLAVADESNILIWDPDSGELVRRIELRKVRRMVFSSDGRRLACHGSPGTFWVVDAGTGKLLVDLPTSGASFGSLSFSPDRGQLVALSDQGRLYRWRLDDNGRVVSTEMLADNGWAPAPVR